MTALTYIVAGVITFVCLYGSIECVPVLVAIGVTEQVHKLVLGMQSGDKDPASRWPEFFKDLKSRRLDSHAVTPKLIGSVTID